MNSTSSGAKRALVWIYAEDAIHAETAQMVPMKMIAVSSSFCYFKLWKERAQVTDN